MKFEVRPRCFPCHWLQPVIDDDDGENKHRIYSAIVWAHKMRPKSGQVSPAPTAIVWVHKMRPKRSGRVSPAPTAAIVWTHEMCPKRNGQVSPAPTTAIVGAHEMRPKKTGRFHLPLPLNSSIGVNVSVPTKLPK